MIQTGPNAELGGVKAGFFRLAYQVAIARVVKIAPMPPAPSQATILTTSLTISVPLKPLDSTESCFLYKSRLCQDYLLGVEFVKQLIQVFVLLASELRTESFPSNLATKVASQTLVAHF